ncbi:hypothetical protein FB451DRAFT_1395082 [Mycena latifolia]|nr:hypothetical protein FB451DRAFT_1395082 [Mycena latifolia]
MAGDGKELASWQHRYRMGSITYPLAALETQLLRSSNARTPAILTPNLREVFLTDTSYAYNSHPIAAPWAQITRFCARLGAAHHLDILRAAPNLLECGLVVLDSDAEPAPGIAVLPRLRRLYVDDGRLLPSLSAPKLGYLFLHGDAAPALSFLQRSRAPLRGLVV